MVDLHLLGEASSALLWLDRNSLALELLGVLLKCCESIYVCGSGSKSQRLVHVSNQVKGGVKFEGVLNCGACEETFVAIER